MSAGERNDAERAHDVAAVLHFQHGPRGVVVAGAEDNEVLAVDRPAVQQFRRGAFAEHVWRRQVLGQVHFVLRAEDQVDAGQPAQLVRSALGIAAGDGHEGVGRLTEGASDRIPAISLGLFRDGAGVQNEQIGRLAERHHLVALLREAVGQYGALGLVEAASDTVQGGPGTL